MQEVNLKADSATVTWKAPSKSSINGKFTKYVVNLNKKDENCWKSLDVTEEKIDFTNLRPYSEYIVQVAACNSAGCGPMKEITFKTAQAGITMIVLTDVFMHAVMNII